MSSSSLKSAIQNLPEDLRNKMSAMTVDSTWPIHKLKSAARRQDDLGKAAKELLNSPAIQFRTKAQEETSLEEVRLTIDEYTLLIRHAGGEKYLQNFIEQAIDEDLLEAQGLAATLRASGKPYGYWIVSIQRGYVITNLIVAKIHQDTGIDKIEIFTKSMLTELNISDATWARIVLAAYNVMITILSFPRDFAELRVRVKGKDPKPANLHKFLYDIVPKPKSVGGKRR